MEAYLVKGHICQSASQNRIETRENSYILVENGCSRGVFNAVPEGCAGLPVLDFGDRLILPGMTDLHVHAPQFAFRGLGADMELLDWLNTYAFPEEAKYCELPYAHKAYDLFVSHLRRSTTTRAAVYGTLHGPATELLMDKLDQAGLGAYVGKVNMDRNSPEFLREGSVAQAVAETEQWLANTLGKYRLVKPILTPRFIPSCTDELMQALKKLQIKYQLPTQSHLSENFGEIALVKKLCPTSRFYGDAYNRFGMFGGDHKCIMAHCVHSGEEEQALMKQNGVFIAHSPESNANLASGVAPVSRYLENGLQVGLASDIAGGSSENLLRAMMCALQYSNLRWRLQDERVKPLSIDQVFYMATEGGGAFFGKVGSFREGYEFDAVVMDENGLDHPQSLSVRSRLERMLYLADDRNVYAKFVAGNRLF